MMHMQKPEYDEYELQRREMVRQLRLYGIVNERVLKAFSEVERHRFFISEYRNRAYEDCACPIGYGQTISQPFTVAYMTSMLAERCPSGNVLEIGTGSGYQAAILDAMGYEVRSVERLPELHERVAKLFGELGIPVELRLGDGSLGWPEHAPYQGIIVTAAAPRIPHALKEQLADGGSLIIPVGGAEGQVMTVLTREGDTFHKATFETFAFVPLVGREGWRRDD